MPTQVGPSWEVPFEQYTDGQNEAVSAASQGRIRYNNATVAFEGSVNGGAYVAFAAGGVGSLDASYNVGRFIFADAGVVDIQNNAANNTGCMLLEKVPAAAQSGNVLEILVGPNASGDGIQIDSTGTGVMIDGNFTGAVASGGFAQYTDNGTFAGAGQFMFSGTNANDARTTRAIYYAENQGNAFDAAMFRGASSGSSTTARGLLLSDDGTGIGTNPFVELAGTNNAATSCMLRIGASGAAALRNYVEFDATNTAVVAVSAASEGRLAYDSVANQFVVSENGGAWSSIVGGGTLDNAYDFGGAGAGGAITADSGAVSIDASAGANACLLLTKASGGGAPAAFNPLDIVTDASQTGTAIRVTHDGGRGMDLIHSTATAFLGGITTTDSGTSVGAGGTFLDITCSNAGRTAGPFLRITGAAASAATGTLIEASCGGAAGQQGLTVHDNGAGASTNAWILFAGNNNLRTGPLLELAGNGVANLTNYMRFGLCDTTVSTIAPLQKGQIALDAGDGLFKVSRNNNAYQPMIVGNPTLPYLPSNVVLTRSFDANSTSLNEIADVVGTLIIDLQNFGDTPLVG